MKTEEEDKGRIIKIVKHWITLLGILSGIIFVTIIVEIILLDKITGLFSKQVAVALALIVMIIGLFVMVAAIYISDDHYPTENNDRI